MAPVEPPVFYFCSLAENLSLSSTPWGKHPLTGSLSTIRRNSLIFFFRYPFIHASIP